MKRPASPHSYACVRTGRRVHTCRPERHHKAARLAWELLALQGPLVDLRLVTGLWMGTRPDGTIDPLDNGWVRQCLTTPTVEQIAIMAALALCYPPKCYRPSPPPECAIIAQRLVKRVRDYQQIAWKLAKQGYKAPTGKPFHASTIRRMLQKISVDTAVSNTIHK